MKRRTLHFIAGPVICFLLLLSYFNLAAQDTMIYKVPGKPLSESYVFIGTQIPVQFTAGYSYRFSNRWSVQAQAGFITKPYSGFIADAMQAFGMDKYLARVIKKAFKSGAVAGIGPNYHFGKNYIGVYGQYMHLTGGGITPGDALSVYFKKDFTRFDVTGLPVFEFQMQSNLVTLGALFGRRFQLRNPRLSINGEVGFSKIVASENGFSSNRTLIDQTAPAQNLYKEINTEMRDAYWKYGFIPTVNLYLVYSL